MHVEVQYIAHRLSLCIISCADKVKYWIERCVTVMIIP
jgi:hypothetical protein